MIEAILAVLFFGGGGIWLWSRRRRDNIEPVDDAQTKGGRRRQEN